jgi:hypothetical protein
MSSRSRTPTRPHVKSRRTSQKQGNASRTQNGVGHQVLDPRLAAY